eukprot:8077192-Ditylum_brightwellii.AAC.1
MMAKAKKSLEGKTNSYPRNFSEANMVDSPLFFIFEQQMKQRENEKAMREQQLLLDCMGREASERSYKEHESQRERQHQDFMMMI